MTPAAGHDQFDSGHVYGAIDAPPQFTSALLSIGTSAPATSATVPEPQVTVLTSPGAGSLASSLATALEQMAIRDGSRRLGAELAARPRTESAQPTPNHRDPVTDFHPPWGKCGVVGCE